MTTKELPISGAIIEIVEYFLAINQEVQYGIKGDKKQHIQVEIITSNVDTEESIRLHRFKVIQRKLCRWFDVDGFLSSTVPDVLQVIPPETHRKGDPDSTQGFFITCPHKDNTTDQPEHHCVTVDQCGRICTHKLSVPTTSASEETSVVLQVMLPQVKIANEVYTIYQYLHKLRICNLQLNLQLRVCTDEAEQSWNFGEDLHGYKYRTGDLKISTDIGHFLRSNGIPSYVMKIKPSIGSRLVISSPPMWDERQIPLKLSVVASIIPPPTCQDNFSNRHCKELWISLFGPGNIPLHIAGKTQFPVDPVQLIRWQDYGLTLGDALPPTNSQDLQVFEADRRYQLSVMQEEDVQDASPSHIIQLFIVLTRNDKNKPLAFHERQDLLQAIRNKMSEYFAENQAKLSLAATTAVNKVLKCHSTESSGQTMSKTRQESVGQAIQNINQAISTLVSYSVHDEFRQKCFSLLQADNSVELCKTVQCKLWTIAKNRLGVNIPQEFQEASISQESVTQSEQDHETQSTASSTFQHQSNSYPKEDSAICNLSPETYSQHPSKFSDDCENTAAAASADFANLDLFPEVDEQWLESIQRQPEGTNGKDDHSQNTHESVQSQQIMQTAMGDDWFEEVLLNCDWMKREY